MSTQDAALEGDDHDDIAASAGKTPEERATLRGWKPLDEFTGPKDKWVPAEDFLKRGEDEAPLLRANLKRLEEKFEKQSKTLLEFAEHHRKTEQRAYERALKDLEARQTDAVKAGNLAEVKAITKEMTELATDAKEKAPEASDGTVSDFEKRNPWYTDNAKARLWAKGLSSELATQGLSAPAQLKEIERQVRTEFPDLFENERRGQASTVESKTAPARRGKTMADLPAEARTICARFVKTIPGFTEAQYLKDYQW